MCKSSQSVNERFFAKVIKTDYCWNWNGCKTYRGYGLFYDGTKHGLVHRFSYRQFVGGIPEGLTIDHLCRNKLCVNPAHLEAVSLKVNILRGFSSGAQNARKTFCKRGHPFDDKNTIVRPTGFRNCRTCRLERQRLRRRAESFMKAIL